MQYCDEYHSSTFYEARNGDPDFNQYLNNTKSENKALT